MLQTKGFMYEDTSGLRTTIENGRLPEPNRQKYIDLQPCPLDLLDPRQSENIYSSVYLSFSIRLY